MASTHPRLARRLSVFRRAVALPACWLAVGCQTPQPTPEQVARCERLLQAPPERWPEAVDAMRDLPAAVAPRLADLIEAQPHAPGAPAATLVLGELDGGDVAARLLRLAQAAPEPVAVEAALALGRRGSEPRALAALAMDPQRPSLLRTAAAAAATQQRRDPAMLKFLCDVLLAATPQGRERGQQLGLPVDRPRWAAERNLAATALSKAAGQDLGIDADSSWPALAASVARARQILELPSP